jgi:hypothetical protein
MGNVAEHEFMSQEALKEGTPSNLLGTTWLISAVNRNFSPFKISFDANSICKVKTVNGYFYGQGTWMGTEASAVFHFTYNNKSTYICSSNPGKGTGTVHAVHDGHTYLMPFTMSKQ